MTVASESTAPAKAILLGEHFVVHGGTALVVPVHALETTVVVGAPGPVDPHAQPWMPAVVRRWPALAEASVIVKSTIPAARGLGTSAALAVALLRASGHAAGQPLEEPGPLLEEARALESQAHGRASGVDTACAALARPLWYDLAGGPRPAALPPLELLVYDSGVASSTRDAVALVARRREADPQGFAALMRAHAGLVERARFALEGAELADLGAVLDSAEGLLASLGLVHQRVAELGSAARAAGALGAKMSGKGCGGIGVALCPPGRSANIASALRAAGAETVLACG